MSGRHRVAATVSSVSASAASASSAAWSGLQGGHSRVFDRPATGALAITRSRASPAILAFGSPATRSPRPFEQGQVLRFRRPPDGQVSWPATARTLPEDWSNMSSYAVVNPATGETVKQYDADH